MKFMKLSGIILFSVLMLMIVDGTLIEYTEESCYGDDGNIDSLQPTCTSGQVIYPHDVYTYSKKLSTRCPWTSHISNRNETYCCRYENETEDCGMRYYGIPSKFLAHYIQFSGRDTGLLQVAWNTTINTCDQSVYFPRTHYMKLTYNCINTSLIGSVCNSTLTGSPLYLWNHGYPDSDDGCGSNSGCSCSVHASGGSFIQIDGLDLRFATSNETSNYCKQRLFITDGSSETDIACDDVNLFERRTLYSSSSSSITIRYDSTNAGSGGNFWIALQATDISQMITISCTQSAQADAEYSCGDNFTIISPQTTPAPEATTSNETTYATPMTIIRTQVTPTLTTTATIRTEITSTSTTTTDTGTISPSTTTPAAGLTSLTSSTSNTGSVTFGTSTTRVISPVTATGPNIASTTTESSLLDKSNQEGALIEYTEESCYGADGNIDSLQPSCTPGQVIYPHDVYTYAKRLSTECPSVSDYRNRNETYCCRYENETEDCGMRYYGEKETFLMHYIEFSGQETGLRRVANNDTINICDQSVYFSETNYMKLTYNCINTSFIGSVCNSSLTGNPLYLWSHGYPDSDGGCGSNSGCSCSVQASGGSSIQIDGLDLRFATNETTNSCSQRLFISDGSSESDIACDDVNLFQRRTLYSSETSSITLRYDNTNTGSGGFFWIALQASDSTESITISCSQSTKADAEYSCGDNFTIISSYTTQEPETTVSKGTSSATAMTVTSIQATASSTTTAIMAGETTSTKTITRNTESTSASTTTLSTPGLSTATSTSTSSSASSVKTTRSATVSITKGSPSSEESSSPASKGPIIGAIVGAVLAVCAVGLIAYSLYRKFKKSSYQVSPEEEDYSLFEREDTVLAGQPPERMIL